MTTTKGEQIKELVAKKEDLFAELRRMPVALINTEWQRDRIEELKYLNAELSRLGAGQGN